MKSHKLLLLSAFLAILPWHAAGAQTAPATLVAQAAAPSQPMPTADEKTAPANVIGKPVPGAQTTDKKKSPSAEETDTRSKPGSTPRQKAPGTDTRGGQRTPAGKTGAPDNAGMPGSGATSGSGGAADPR